MRPLFSVIIPIYNIEKYLRICLNSILHQTFTNIEIILVNDGSTDNCSYICDDYAKVYSRIKVIHKVNGGLVSARQAGVAVATGEYIACIDGDDWISEDFFAKFAEVIDRFHIDVACCGAVWVYEHKEIRKTVGVRCGYYHREQIEKEIFPILIEGSNGVYFAPSLWAKVFKRDIYYQQQLVDAVVSIGEDIACVKPCIFHSKSMYVFNDTLY